uniref:Uncharacterized protein n=1 Tax=Moniliophthora roreri TaxID=221103 RepID=A0A0W0F4W5_MONRR
MLLPIRTNKPLLWALGFDPKALVYSTSTDPQRAQYHIMILRTRAKVDSALDQSSGLFSAFLIRRGARPCPQEVENVDTNELRGHSVCMSLQPGVDTLFQHDNSAHLTCAAEASKFLSAPVTVRMNIEVVCEACEVPSSQARPDVTESVVSSMASYKYWPHMIGLVIDDFMARSRPYRPVLLTLTSDYYKTCHNDSDALLHSSVSRRNHTFVYVLPLRLKPWTRPMPTPDVLSDPVVGGRVPDPSARTGASNEIVTSTLAGIWAPIPLFRAEPRKVHEDRGAAWFIRVNT